MAAHWRIARIGGTNRNKNEQNFFTRQRIAALDELEKLKAKYEERHFCELQKGNVCTLQAAAKCALNMLRLLNHL